MVDCKEFFDKTRRHLKDIRDSQKDNILKASKLMGDCMNNGGIVQLVGFGNDSEFSMELGYRAGGLMPFHKFDVKNLPSKGLVSLDAYNDPNFLDHIEYAKTFWDSYNIDPRDMFIVTCADDSVAMAVEIAKMAKEEGRTVIAVISSATAKVTTSRHPSGKKVSDFADLVLDEQAQQPDTIVEIAPGIKMCQMASITGNVIAQFLTAETYRYLVEADKDCPVLFSVNVAGADAHNRAISDKYLGRWNS